MACRGCRRRVCECLMVAIAMLVYWLGWSTVPRLLLITLAHSSSLQSKVILKHWTGWPWIDFDKCFPSFCVWLTSVSVLW